MPSYFKDQTEIKASWRAVQLWQILVGCACNQQILTYGQLAEMMGYKKTFPLPLTWPLGHIMFYCQDEKLPPLTALVVRKDGGAPGEGLEIDWEEYETLDAARMAVFEYGKKWHSIIPPTAEQFNQTWENAKAEGRG